MDSQVVSALDETCKDGVKLGNEVRNLTQQYEEKHEAFLLQNGKTAESVLELCKVVHQARVRLLHFPTRLADFRKNTKLTNKSTFSQYCTIGMNYNTLYPHASKLPASWYALYQIARLKDEVLEKALANGKIHPTVTQGQLDVLAGRNTKQAANARRFFQFEFPATTPFVADEVKTFIHAALNFLKTQPAPFNSDVAISWSKPFEDVIHPKAPSRRRTRKTPPVPVAATTPSQPMHEAVTDEEIKKFFESVQNAA